jgi:predicted ATPase
VTSAIGKNGSGKSTLLEAMAVAWKSDAGAGTQNYRLEIRARRSPLHDI